MTKETVFVFGREVDLRPGRPDMKSAKIALRFRNGKYILTHGKYVSRKAIYEFLNSEKIKKFMVRSEREEALRADSRDKDKLKFLGKVCCVARVFGASRPDIAIGEREVKLFLPSEAFDEERYIKEFLTRELERLVEKYIDKWTRLTGIERPARVKVTEAGSYWGKMFLKTREMRVSLRLIEKREECIDYLVLHELAHLRYPDHGAAFHAFLDRFLPGNRALERLLKS